MTPVGRPIGPVVFATFGGDKKLSLTEGMDMERSVRLRIGLAAPVLGVLYFYFLVFLIGWTAARAWPSWWFGIFPDRHIAALTWMIGLHTIGVISAALPIAFAVVVIVRKQSTLLGVIVGVIATTLAVLPSLSPKIWPVVWNSHPILFITDQIKLLVAVPIAAWIIGKLLSHSGSPTTAFRQRV
jgi:hypothetical protein